MKYLLILTLLDILLVSCASASTLEPTSTAIITPLPIATFTLTPEPTFTTMPLVVAALNPYLIGIGDHGAIICLRPDQPEQLESLSITATILQNESTIEHNVESQQINGFGTCFEMLDTRYAIGLNVKVELKINEKENGIENNSQISELGSFGNRFGRANPSILQQCYR